MQRPISITVTRCRNRETATKRSPSCRAIRLDPGDAQGHYCLGEVLSELKKAKRPLPPTARRFGSRPPTPITTSVWRTRCKPTGSSTRPLPPFCAAIRLEPGDAGLTTPEFGLRSRENSRRPSPRSAKWSDHARQRRGGLISGTLTRWEHDEVIALCREAIRLRRKTQLRLALGYYWTGPGSWTRRSRAIARRSDCADEALRLLLPRLRTRSTGSATRRSPPVVSRSGRAEATGPGWPRLRPGTRG